MQHSQMQNSVTSYLLQEILSLHEKTPLDEFSVFLELVYPPHYLCKFEKLKSEFIEADISLGLVTECFS